MRVSVWIGSLLVCSVATADDAYERRPVEYSQSTPVNRISQLQDQLDRGDVILDHDARFGYLPFLLKTLAIPKESQMLVFSKTSLQRDRISPRTPRALYFDDDVYVGYCHRGKTLEISVADPKLGAVFYTLDQKTDAAPSFVRQTDRCLICHGGSQTDGVPGHLVRSLFVDRTGQPMLGEGTFRVNHTTPLENRWGGWYVTGTHGVQTHLGNLISQGEVPRPVVNDEGRNVTDLAPFLSTKNYLTPHSDIVALMVLEHQVLVHNLLTKANFATREALAYEAQLKQVLGEPPENRMSSTTSRIKNACDKLLEGLLFVGEAKLEAPIEGTTSYAELFCNAGQRDSKGRSLRELDLTTRLFKYPCSYLIYSTAFDRLPSEAKTYVATRLQNILTGGDNDESFAHLSREERTAILEILRDTKSDLFP